MSPKSIILLAMALGCGLIAAVGINQIMARPSGEAPTAQIVVAKREIQKGEPFRPDDIRLMDWPKETVPEGALDSVEKLVDMRSKGMIYPGEPIIDKKLIKKGDMTSLSTEFPPGMKGISVKVDNESGIAGMILPGDNVDVLVYVEANPSKQIFATSTIPIEQNMKVMAVDDQITRPDGRETSISAKTVTLLASPKQAGRITHACEIGKVRLVLRSGKDGADGPDNGTYSTSTGELLNGTNSAGDSGSAPKSEHKIVDLPPVDDVGKQFATGVDAMRDLLETMKQAREGVEPKPQPYVVVLIEGPETREIEFEPGAGKGRKGPGLAQLKGSAGGVPTGGVDPATKLNETKPAPVEPSPEQMQTLEKMFNPQAQPGGLKGGRTSLVH